MLLSSRLHAIDCMLKHNTVDAIHRQHYINLLGNCEAISVGKTLCKMVDEAGEIILIIYIFK